ncbi:hypothetical protein Hanom_Chr16g01470321 [Helianthus anomalus]
MHFPKTFLHGITKLIYTLSIAILVHATLSLQLRFITLSIIDVPIIPLYDISLNLIADSLCSPAEWDNSIGRSR